MDTEENKKLYELQQKQRYNERKIREWKRRRDVKEAAGLDTTKEKAKVREWNKRNKELISSDPRLKRKSK
nr:phage minor capsid protein [Amedibacterium intestinale]